MKKKNDKTWIVILVPGIILCAGQMISDLGNIGTGNVTKTSSFLYNAASWFGRNIYGLIGLFVVWLAIKYKKADKKEHETNNDEAEGNNDND